MSFIADDLSSMSVAEYEQWLKNQLPEKQIGAQTGRMSCAEPNLSTLPKD